MNTMHNNNSEGRLPLLCICSTLLTSYSLVWGVVVLQPSCLPLIFEWYGGWRNRTLCCHKKVNVSLLVYVLDLSQDFVQMWILVALRSDHGWICSSWECFWAGFFVNEHIICIRCAFRCISFAAGCLLWSSMFRSCDSLPLQRISFSQTPRVICSSNLSSFIISNSVLASSNAQ